MLGDPWPSVDVRLEMLEEAVEVMRELWTGGFVTTATASTTPSTRPHLHAPGRAARRCTSPAFGPKATDLAARIGDGYISTQSDPDLVTRFKEASGGKPAQAGAKVAYADTVDEGVEHAHRLWANAGLPGELAQVLPSPRHFEQASQLVTEESTARVRGRGQRPRGAPGAGHGRTPTPATTSSTSPTWARTTSEMIEFYGREVLPELRGQG